MRAFAYEYKIDGQPILAPDAGVEISYSDLDSEGSGRDESGLLHREVIRHDVCTWGLSYAALTAEEHKYITSLFRGKSTFTFSVLGADGQTEEFTAYCSKRSITFYDQRLGLYKNLKFNIIEC